MPNRSKYLQAEPRASSMTFAECFAAPELFQPWEQMTKAARREFSVNGPIPCEGGGVPGEWCARCRFGKVGEPELVNPQET